MLYTTQNNVYKKNLERKMKKVSTLCFVLLLLASKYVFAQAPDYSQLDPKSYDPETEPNIDMFFSSWQESMPQSVFGCLIERAIFTKWEGDPLSPTTRGKILNNFNRFSHGTLFPGATTKPSTLKDEQIVFYVDSGKGTIKAGNKTGNLYEGVGILMPPGIEFTMSNTGDDLLTMYIISEPLSPGFKPNKEMLVVDENDKPDVDARGHWCHIFKGLFWKKDGLSTITGMGPVWYDVMTMGQPHSHGEGNEEIWFALKGDINVLLGKQLRKMPPGTAYKIPPNGTTPHSNINTSDKPIKMFWFMKTPTSVKNE